MFEITGKDVSQLGDEDLRTLTKLIVIAELSEKGLPISSVNAGGDQNARDEGIDVNVCISESSFVGDFIKRPDTGFQVKLPDMTRKEIINEMKPKGVLRESIIELGNKNGAYIIVSGNSNTTGSALKRRKEAMKDALKGSTFENEIHLDFYDQEKISNWIQKYPGVELWMLRTIGRNYGGWQSILHLPKSGNYLYDNEKKIIDKRSYKYNQLTLLDSIDLIRNLLNQPRNCLRIVGESGTGKTRFIQALFDISLGKSNVLDSAITIYADIGDEPDPPVTHMAYQLLKIKKRAILIIDNCNPETHSSLTKICERDESQISLITIEYDICDDAPRETLVFQMVKCSVSIIEIWLKEKYSFIYEIDRRKIAIFSGGNFRIAEVLANTFKQGYSLGILNDEYLFKRLFFQRNSEDDRLMRSGEILSLLYSFDGEDTNRESELSILANFFGSSILELTRNTQELTRRGLLQSRGKWRAILPQAIGNRLAYKGFDNILPRDLDSFVFSLPPRMLKSLTHRIGYLHNIPHIENTIQRWVNKRPELADLAKINSDWWQIIENILPVYPECILQKIELSLNSKTSQDIISIENINRRYWIKTLKCLAYDEEFFKRSIMLLTKFFAEEPENYNNNSASSVLLSFFYIYYSGTLASPHTRRSVIKELVQKNQGLYQKYGFLALEAMLKTRNFHNNIIIEFGARSRTYGWHPQSKSEEISWYMEAINLLKEFSNNRFYLDRIKEIIARTLHDLWNISDIHYVLTNLIKEIIEEGFWVEGWTAVLAACQHNSDFRSSMSELDGLLKPKNIFEEARAYILTNKWNALEGLNEDNCAQKRYFRAENYSELLGNNLSNNPEILNKLLPEVTTGGAGRKFGFGLGLASTCKDPIMLWQEIKINCQSHSIEKRSFSVLGGFISKLSLHNPIIAEQLLEESITDKLLAPVFPYLQVSAGLNSNSVDRLHRALKSGLTPIYAFEELSYYDVTKNISDKFLANLLTEVTKVEHGINIATKILFIHIHESMEFRNIDLLRLAENILLKTQFDRINNLDHELGTIAEACFKNSKNNNIARKVCKNLIKGFKANNSIVHSSQWILRAIFNTQPLIALDEIILKINSSIEWELSQKIPSTGKPIIEEIEFQIIVDWAVHDPIKRFNILGKILNPFIDNKGGFIEFSSLFLNLLINCPNKLHFLNQMNEKLEPTGWKGDYSESIRERIRTINKLHSYIDHEDVKIWINNQIDRLEVVASEAIGYEIKKSERFE